MDPATRSSIELALILLAIECILRLVGDMLVTAFVGLVVHQAKKVVPKNWSDAQDGFGAFLWERWVEETSRCSSRLWAFCRLLGKNWQLVCPSMVQKLAAPFSDSCQQVAGRGSVKLRVACSPRPRYIKPVNVSLLIGDVLEMEVFVENEASELFLEQALKEYPKSGDIVNVPDDVVEELVSSMKMGVKRRGKEK